MREPSIVPTTVERFFAEDEIIVSKTDLKGHITYANETFLKIADYTEEEVLGKAHSIIRHPDMPRCVFKLLWDTIRGSERDFCVREKHGEKRRLLLGLRARDADLR